MKRGLPAAALVAAVTLTLASCGTGGAPGGSSSPTANLEVVSWWTSGSEQEALQVLFDAYTAAHPGVQVSNATVAGGGGSNAQVVLAQRLLAGKPPDVWQTFPGGALDRYVDQKQVADVSAVYADTGLAAAVPKGILDGLTVKGKQYGVPTSSHRGNVLFYNLDVLRKAGIAVPTDDYSAADFADDLDELAKAGITPLCLGAKDPFTTAALFENVLLGVVGPDGWSKIRQDRFDWNGPQVREALDRFGALLDRADPGAAALSWDAATQKLASGGCAFETVNDSAFGELVKAGAVDGTDFGEVPYPGTRGVYVAVVDTLVQARKPVNGRNATDFLTTAAAGPTELAFSKAKGSVPIRNDVDVSSLTPYQRQAARSLREDDVVWSIVHGEAMSPAFQQGFYDAVQTYVRSRDAGTFSKTLAAGLNQGAPPK